MPPFPKPDFTYNYSVAAQIAALRRWRDTEPGRAVPAKTDNHLLVATWNVANLGTQERSRRDYTLLAEIMSWFDLVAIQEVNDNLVGLRSLLTELPNTYRTLFSDKAGNEERLAYLYDSAKLTVREKVGEIAIPPSEHRHIRLTNNSATFDGFDRNPYLAAFQIGGFDFVVVNCHLFFGSDDDQHDIDRRALETYAVARWADLRRSSDYAYSRNIIALGDFNLPAMDWSDPIFRALGSRGLYLVPHSSGLGTNLASDRHYDQIAFFPGPTEQRNTAAGIFDFDGAVFNYLWEARPANDHRDFYRYVRYYLSDHRPMWAQFAT